MDARITFDLRAQTVTIEGPGDLLTRLFDAVRGVVPDLEVRVIPGKAQPTERTPSPPPTTSKARENAIVSPFTVRDLFAQFKLQPQRGTSDSAHPSVRDFARSFEAKSTIDRILVLAAFATQRGAPFSAQEMIEWFEECAFEHPANMSIALNDARLKAEILQRGERNQWTLTPTGIERLASLRRSGSTR